MRIYRWCLNNARRILGAISFLIPRVHEFPAKPRRMGKFRRGFVTALFAIFVGAIIFSPTCYSSAFGPTDYTWSGGAAPVWVSDGGVNFRLKFISSGTFTPKKPLVIDLFLLGGGGGGGNSRDVSGGIGGGGGGYAGTWSSVSLSAGTSYSVVIGSGGAAMTTGGTTSFNSTYSKSGGIGGTLNDSYGKNGGSGGGAGSYTTAAGAGGVNGGNGGASGTLTGGVGQGASTYEFGDSTLALYAGGGGGGAGSSGGAGAGGNGGGAAGGASYSSGNSAAANTGGGGGGAGRSGSGGASGGSGGSGICVMRNHR